jgi:hypothetical protein
LVVRRAGHALERRSIGLLAPATAAARQRDELLGATSRVGEQPLDGGVGLEQARDGVGAVHDERRIGCSVPSHPLKIALVVAAPMPKVLHRYIFREILVPFALGLGVFTFVLLLARLLKLIELVVNRGIPAATVGRVFLYLLPAFLEVTVPMAMLLAILVAFGRLSADSEITALRSSGVSLYQLIPPVATFVVIVTVLTAGLAWYGRPWGNRALRTAMWDIARTPRDRRPEAPDLQRRVPGPHHLREQIDAAADQLERVLISDERDRSSRTGSHAPAT